MNITLSPALSRDGKKTWYTFEWGKAANQRRAAHVYTWTHPRSQIEKDYNKQALALLETKRSQLVLEFQVVGTGFIPSHKYKANFLDYYDEFVRNNKQEGNRHMEGSFTHFRAFLVKKFLSPVDMTESLALRFRQYLLERFNGDTPANYFTRFKKMLKAATKEGYFRLSPVDDLKAKTGKGKKLKEHLEANEYVQLLKTPCTNEEVREAFILCCYTGIRWCDVKPLDWEDIKGDQLKTRLIQAKTGEPVYITLHPIAREILLKRKATLAPETKEGRVFKLPTQDGAKDTGQVVP